MIVHILMKCIAIRAKNNKSVINFNTIAHQTLMEYLIEMLLRHVFGQKNQKTSAIFNYKNYFLNHFVSVNFYSNLLYNAYLTYSCQKTTDFYNFLENCGKFYSFENLSEKFTRYFLVTGLILKNTSKNLSIQVSIILDVKKNI